MSEKTIWIIAFIVVCVGGRLLRNYIVKKINEKNRSGSVSEESNPQK